MSTLDQVLNDVATIIVFAVAVPAHALVFIYGLGSPWYRSVLGVTIFAKWLSVALVFDYLISRRLWGEWPGFGVTAIAVYGFMFLAFSAVVAEVVIERRDPAALGSIPIRKDNSMSKHLSVGTDENGNRAIVDETGTPTGIPSPKVIASVVTGIGLTVAVGAIAAITPDHFASLGLWGGVVYGGVVALGSSLAAYIKRP